MASRIRLYGYWLLLATLVFLGLPGGCSKDETTKPADDGVRIADIEIDKSALGPGDSTEVRVWVVRGDDEPSPVDGVQVVFTELLHQAQGTFSKDEVFTNSAGWAASTYRPTGSADRNVTLKVAAGGDIEYVQLQVSATPSAGIDIAWTTSSGATSIPADGTSSVAITLRATRGVAVTPVSNKSVILAAGDQFVDLDGNGVFSGTDQVVSGGDRNSDGLWDAEGSIPEQVTTDLNGSATFLYTSGTAEGNVYIKATVDGVAEDFILYQHPTTLQVRAAAQTRELLADGVSQTSIQAAVLDWGNIPIGGVVVRFVAGEVFTDVDHDGYYSPGIDSYEDANENGRWDAIGSIESVSTTDGAGSAYAIYTAGLEVGPVAIRATTSSGSAVTIVDLVEVPPASVLDLAMNPNILPADGVSTSTGSVLVRDVNGALVTGKRLNVVAGERFEDRNNDGYFTTGIDILLDDADESGTWTARGDVAAEAFTGSTGEATFSYTSDLEPGTVWVRVAADGVSVETQVSQQDLPTVWTMVLSSSADRLSVSGAGGVDNTIITARASDAQGNPVTAGVPIQFSVASGPGGGEQIQGASSGIYTARTDATGSAQAVLSAGTAPGVVTVQGRAGTTTRTLEVVIGPGRAASISARSIDTQVEFWSSTTIEAAIRDAHGNPVEDGTAVEFRVDEGQLVGTDGAGLSRTEGGIAQATYQSLGPAANTDYVAEIEISVPNTSVEETLELPLVEPVSAAIEILRLSSNLGEVALQGTGGNEEAIITVQALDSQGRAVGGGYDVQFEIAEGPNGGESIGFSGWGPLTRTTDGAGRASVVLRSGLTPGVVEVRASFEDVVSPAVQVGIASGAILNVECYADSVALQPNSQSTVYAYVYDAQHNSVPDGTVVWFYADEGLIDGVEGGGSTFTENGIATATYTATPNLSSGDGLAVISVETTDGASCNRTIEILRAAGDVETIGLNPEISEIGVLGTGAIEQTRIYARGFDAYGNAVGPSVPITFRIVDGPGGGEGFLSGSGPVVALTNPLGVAEASLRAGTVSGTVLVEARAENGTSQTTPIAIAAGPPAYLHIGNVLCNVLACGRVNVENELVVIVGDVYHNPARDGTVVYFTVDQGTIHGDDTGGLGSDITEDGVAGAIWRSGGNSCETVTVTASTSGGTVVGSTTFIASDDPYSAEILSPTASSVDLAADGLVELPMWVEVLDFFGMYTLPSGLDWTTTYGNMASSDETADGCNQSVARAVYRSSTLDRDYSVTTPDDGIGAVDNVVVSTGYGGASDAIQINLRTSGAFRDECDLEVGGAVSTGGSVSFTVTIADRYGNPLGGHTLSASVSGGTVSALSPTDEWGASNGTFFAPDAAGSVSLTVLDTDPTYGGVLLTATITVSD